MRKLILCALFALLSLPVVASEEDNGTYIRYYGTGTTNGSALFTTGEGNFNVSRKQYCVLMSTAGAVDVFVSLDGTNYATAALSLQDMGATTTDPVIVTVAGRLYGFVVKARNIIVKQNGATAASASMNCW